VNEKTRGERREKYELALNPIGSFIEQAIAGDLTESDKVIKDELYRAYTRFCKEKRLAVESKENFGKILKKQFNYQDGREASVDNTSSYLYLNQTISNIITEPE
jgi:phage/plasmid-associated DNA primase